MDQLKERKLFTVLECYKIARAWKFSPPGTEFAETVSLLYPDDNFDELKEMAG